VVDAEAGQAVFFGIAVEAEGKALAVVRLAVADGQIAALVMHAGQAIAHELLGDEGERIAVALLRLCCREALPLAHIVEHLPRAGGDAADTRASRDRR